MAEKKTAKKEFAWDTEKRIGEFGDDKRKTEVNICTLNGKTYVSAQHYVMSAKIGDWKRAKNNTMEIGIFKELQAIVSDWEMIEAFKSDIEEEIVVKKKDKTKATTKKK